MCQHTIIDLPCVHKRRLLTSCDEFQDLKNGMREMIDLEGYLFKVNQYEDSVKLDAALEVMPLDRLYDEAAANVDQAPYCEEDRLVIALLKWFKAWFKWVDAPLCNRCRQSNQMVGPQQGSPSDEERKYDTQVTEIWLCKVCETTTRFPRYNDPVKLLSSRKGRCGEWCNAMQLLLRSLGRDVRYIWNSEDHVWNEVWSADQNRWIHVDSCEAAFDKPLIYADGWGKKMAYVLGFSVGGVKEVTRRYVRRNDAALPRTLIKEDKLALWISILTANQRKNMDPVDLVEWYERDDAECRELDSLLRAVKADEYFLPRQSGSSEWVKQRGEAGN